MQWTIAIWGAMRPVAMELCRLTWMVFRYHCAIETEEAVVLTGGYVSMFLVTKYNMEGEAEDLPNLIYGRCNHACGEVTRSDGSIVSLGMEHENMMNLTFHHLQTCRPILWRVENSTEAKSCPLLRSWWRTEELPGNLLLNCHIKPDHYEEFH